MNRHANTKAFRRRLRLESLEGRRLLAADGLSSSLFTAADPTDVLEQQPALVLQAAGDDSGPATSLSTGSVVIGENAPDFNFIPFGSRSGTRYQQVYSAAEFPDDLSINGVKFFHHAFDGIPGELANGVFNFDFSVTTQAVDGLDTVNLDNNVTGDVLGTGTLILGGGGGHDLIIGVTPFSYDPELGNLLMDIQYPDGLTRDPGLPAFFEAYNGEDGTSAGGIFSRAYNSGGEGFAGWGLKTEFLLGTTPLSSAVVELIVDGGNLTLIGNDESNEVIITQGATPDEFILDSTVTDFGAGAGVPVTVSGITGDVMIEFGAAADTLQVGGINDSLSLPGDLIVGGGDGHDVINVGGDAGQDGLSVVEIAGDVEVTGGDGNNLTTIGGRDAYNEEYYGETVVRISGDVEIGNDDGDNRTIIAGRTWNYGSSTLEIGGDVEVSNGDGNNSTRIGDDVDYGKGTVDIDGDVAIRNGDGLNNTRIGGSGAYDAFHPIPASSQVLINGDLEIVNGHGGSVTQVGANGGYYGSRVAITGDVDIRNGNASDSTTIGGDGGYRASHVLIEGDVRINNRGGDDYTSVGNDGGYDGFSGVDILGDLEIRNGDGDDQTRVGGDGGNYGTSDLHIAGDVEIKNGLGNDDTRFGGDGSYYYGHAIVNIDGDVNVANGQGDDITRIGGDGGGGKYYSGGDSNITIAGDIEIKNGDGDDQVHIGGDGGKSPYGGGDSTIAIAGDLTVRGGLGADRTELGGRCRDGDSILQIEGNVLINGGAGNDKAILRARKDATITFGSDLTIKGGDGKDRVRIENIDVAGITKIKTGADKDLIRIKDSIFAGLVKIDLGCDLDDLFDDEGGNVFAGGLIVEEC